MSRTARLSVVERKADEALAAVRHAEQSCEPMPTPGPLEALRGPARHDVADQWAAREPKTTAGG